MPLCSRFKSRIQKQESRRKHTCRAEACDIQDGNRQGVLFRASYVVSLAFPQSTTKTTSLIVILASAIFVASTILRTFAGGLSNMSFWKYYNTQLRINKSAVKQLTKQNDRKLYSKFLITQAS